MFDSKRKNRDRAVEAVRVRVRVRVRARIRIFYMNIVFQALNPVRLFCDLG